MASSSGDDLENLQPRSPGTEDKKEHIQCPRCNATETKFCYFNNYNLSQPRHFCKSCRRYWTKGGTLRNVPIGGSRRSLKRPRSPSPSSETKMVNPSNDLGVGASFNFDGFVPQATSHIVPEPLSPGDEVFETNDMDFHMGGDGAGQTNDIATTGNPEWQLDNPDPSGFIGWSDFPPTTTINRKQ